MSTSGYPAPGLGKAFAVAMLALFLLASCSPSPATPVPVSPTLTAAAGPTSTLPAPSPTLAPAPLPGPVIHEEPGPIYETVFRIPVGEEGIRYRGEGIEEIEVTGPNGIAVLPDGSFVIGDTYDNRLLRYDASGTLLQAIDLSSLGIVNVSDIVSTSSELYVLEISFSVAPVRYRVSRLSFEGDLIAQFDVPEGYHFEDGLFGLGLSGDRVYLELRGPLVRFYLLPGPQADDSGEFYGLPVDDRLVQTHYPGPCGGDPSITIGDQRYETGMTLDSALDVLAGNPDGSLYVLRGDIVADTPAIVADQTIHFIDAAGEPRGAARYPLAEWYFHLMEYLTVGPDGEIYALITRPDSIDVIRLNFYQRRDPLVPGAAEPSITRGPLEFTTGPRCDCSQVVHLPPDSPEAQAIVTEVVDNFRRDWPTEYMAVERLWALDRLGEYAVIQGRVTQEQSDVLVAQQSPRGYVLLADYVVTVPGPAHSIIPEYLRSRVPDAPPELLYCLDLRRYLEASP